MAVKTLKTCDSKVLHPARDSHSSCFKTAQEGQRKWKGPNTVRDAMKHCHKHDPIKAITISHQNGLKQTGPVKQQQQMVKAQLALLLPDELWSTDKALSVVI